MKVKGDELIAFVEQAWPKPEEDWYWDHECFDHPDPSAVYDTDEIGPVQYQGHEEDPTNNNGYNLATLIKRWRKDRDYDVLTVEVPKAQTDAVRAAIISAGGKIA